eukprot:1596309-Pyramimonas_sp.AAC.4
MWQKRGIFARTDTAKCAIGMLHWHVSGQLCKVMVKPGNLRAVEGLLLVTLAFRTTERQKITTHLLTVPTIATMSTHDEVRCPLLFPPPRLFGDARGKQAWKPIFKYWRCPPAGFVAHYR